MIRWVGPGGIGSERFVGATVGANCNSPLWSPLRSVSLSQALAVALICLVTVPLRPRTIAPTV